jgi:hypothetical protein
MKEEEQIKCGYNEKIMEEQKNSINTDEGIQKQEKEEHYQNVQEKNTMR